MIYKKINRTKLRKYGAGGMPDFSAFNNSGADTTNGSIFDFNNPNWQQSNLSKGIGVGAGAIDNSMTGISNSQTVNTAGATAKGALKGAAKGAEIGSSLGIYGTVVGGAVGLIAGGVSSLIGANSKNKKAIAERAGFAQQQTNLNSTRSQAELADYPVNGVVGAQYYAKGGLISKYYKKLAEGGTVPNTKLPTYNPDYKTSLYPINKKLPIYDPSILTNGEFIVQKDNGTIGHWGSLFSPPVPTQLIQGKGPILPSDKALGYTNTYYPSNSNRTTPTPDVIPRSANYYAKGGLVKPPPYMPHMLDPDTLQDVTDLQDYASGGIPNPQYEVERGEVVQGQPSLEDSSQLSSDMHLVGGDTHENGGTMGAGGDRVYSDRLKLSTELAQILKEAKISIPNNSTYADAAAKIGRLKGKMEDKLETKFQPSINTANKMNDRLDQASDILFQDQEFQKQSKTNAPTYAMGGRLPRYRNGVVLPDASGIGNDTYTQGLSDAVGSSTAASNAFAADGTQTINPYNVLTPDVAPQEGQTFLQKASKFANDNQGEITNFASYLSNLSSIHKLDTSVKRNYLSAPVYSYVNRSGQAVNDNQKMLRTTLSALTGSSQGVNASNAGALYAATLDANSKIANNENLRHDAYNEQYGQRADRVNEFNTQTFNQASDSQRDLNNNKNVVLPLQARNAWLQGVMGNQQMKAQQQSDRTKLALSILANDQNGVMTRLGKNYAGKKSQLSSIIDAIINQ